MVCKSEFHRRDTDVCRIQTGQVVALSVVQGPSVGIGTVQKWHGEEGREDGVLEQCEGRAWGDPQQQRIIKKRKDIKRLAVRRH